MASVQELKDMLKRMEEAIRQKLPDIAVGVSLSAKAISERAIKDAGFGKTYSQNKIPAFLLWGKELNASGTTFLVNHGVKADGTQGEAKKKRRKKKGDPDPGSFNTMTNWAEFRDAQGLQNQFVDLSYSNQMWSNMQPVGVVQKGDLYLAPLGATNTEAQNKMNWNFKRYGDFVGVMIKEQQREALIQYVIGEAETVIRQFL